MLHPCSECSTYSGAACHALGQVLAYARLRVVAMTWPSIPPWRPVVMVRVAIRRAREPGTGHTAMEDGRLQTRITARSTNLGQPARKTERLCRCSASLNTAFEGRRLRGGQGRAGTKRLGLRSPAHDRRAISVPLPRVTRGQPGSLGTARDAWSASLAAVIVTLPKLIVRVRFSSPAPWVPAQLRAEMLS
jgi:hypothetical protein